jgi:integrase
MPDETTEKKTIRRVTLTPKLIASLKPDPSAPYFMTDLVVPGLQLRVSAIDGSKSFSVRYRDKAGRQQRYTLGREDVLTLAEARLRAKNALKAAANGDDPQRLKKANRVADTLETFSVVYMDEWAKKHKRSWRADDSYLKNVILPKWKTMLVKDVTRHDAQALIDAIAKRGPIYANRVRALLHRLFAFAVERGVIDVNVISRTTKPGAEQRRDRVLTHEEIRQFWTGTEALSLPMQSVWRMRLITAQRKSEIQNATWNQIDTSTGWWTIPATRSKNKLAHRVWLSSTALDIVRALKREQDAQLAQQQEAWRQHPDSRKEPQPERFIFASARGKRQQREAAANFGISDFHGHDLRRTAAALMTGSGIQRLVVKKILNHADHEVTAIYDRHSYDPEKKIALDSWARTLDGIIQEKDTANVLTFTRA